MHLSSGLSTDTPLEVRFHPGHLIDGFAVQVFFGNSAYHTLYLSIEETRSFAEKLLAVLPAAEEVQA